MTHQQAQQLHNRDEVEVLTPDGKDWEAGYVLGSPTVVAGGIIVIPVNTPRNGFREVYQDEIR